jgi:hypothetical protein
MSIDLKGDEILKKFREHCKSCVRLVGEINIERPFSEFCGRRDVSHAHQMVTVSLEHFGSRDLEALSRSLPLLLWRRLSQSPFEVLNEGQFHHKRSTARLANVSVDGQKK